MLFFQWLFVVNNFLFVRRSSHRWEGLVILIAPTSQLMLHFLLTRKEEFKVTLRESNIEKDLWIGWRKTAGKRCKGAR